ncbi:hypothetical protein C7391_1316 [Methanimicrococcus blatticola]|uniref:YgjP-like metallopeptidase domain-containing protein n=2 Tax=Methanimicrococcus blatticola TaxID=91560 RepID=A0A484F3A1_9EURY|nr:hypothetical protein C7391_1316 [Methanimicrococcus blatticola]
MPPVRPAVGEKTMSVVIPFGSVQLDSVIIFSKKRKKTLSYTVRYEMLDSGKLDSKSIQSEATNSETANSKPVLFVRAPASLSVNEIQSVLLENEENIIELLNKAAKKEEAVLKNSKQSYKNGSTFHYMGRTYTLRLIYDVNENNEKKIQIRLIDGQLQVYLPRNMIDLPETEKEKKIKKAVESFYIEQADVFFNSRVDYFADKYLDLIGKKPISVKAASYKSKWGCCTYQNEIKLNWVLIQAETPVIDYVIVHELCHIRHKDHSKAFWNLVGIIDPKYKEKRQELKENGWILGIK